MVILSTRASPTIRRRRLGSQLRRLREAAGFNIERVAAALECSSSKISRIETGQVSLKVGELREMLAIYGVGESEQTALIELAREARLRSPLRAQGISAATQTAIDFEIAATSIRAYGGLLLPGLLQTAGYARAVISVLRRDVTPDEVEEGVNLRLTRQDILTSVDPPDYWAIVDHSALLRPVGGRDAMRDQLRHLIDVAALPNVTLQVLPFANGAHPGLSGDFTIFSFSEPTDQDIVYLEHKKSAYYLDQPEEVRQYTHAFDDLRAEALSPRESLIALASYTSAEAEFGYDTKDHA
jgi:transcriptional regulator with XRE-family HTH domain